MTRDGELPELRWSGKLTLKTKKRPNRQKENAYCLAWNQPGEFPWLQPKERNLNGEAGEVLAEWCLCWQAIAAMDGAFGNLRCPTTDPVKLPPCRHVLQKVFGTTTQRYQHKADLRHIRMQSGHHQTIV